MKILNYNPAMRYRAFGSCRDVQVSMLGFGAMRLPMADGQIDHPRAIELLEAGLEGGINYIDTAYVYNKGESEQVVGELLDNGWRAKTYVATKLPVWDLTQAGDQNELFATQLRRLRSERSDFYLLHCINKRYWEIILKTHTLEWLEGEKKRGRIRFAGFSFHDDFELFKEVIDAYHWDFCQIQYNYAQPDFQAGVRGLRYAAAKGIGVAVMEPLFGGFLAGSQLPPGALRLFEEKGLDPVAVALRWLWNQPEPAVVLSGMSELQQVQENLRTASSAAAGALSEPEAEVLERVCGLMRESVAIGCTQCGYCLHSCPAGVKIPAMFEIYNKHLLFERRHTLQPALYRGHLPQERAAACSGCGACREHCPQGIDIPAWLKIVVAEFEA